MTTTELAAMTMLDKRQAVIARRYPIHDDWMRPHFTALLEDLGIRSLEMGRTAYNAFFEAAADEGKTGRYPILPPVDPEERQRMRVELMSAATARARTYIAAANVNSTSR